MSLSCTALTNKIWGIRCLSDENGEGDCSIGCGLDDEFLGVEDWFTVEDAGLES